MEKAEKEWIYGYITEYINGYIMNGYIYMNGYMKWIYMNGYMNGYITESLCCKPKTNPTL